MQSVSTRNILLISGLLLFLVARLGLAWIAFTYPERSIKVDSLQYLQLADSIRMKGQFEATEYLEEVRTPGYPLFLAAVQAIFGQYIGPVILIQLIFTILNAWILYRLGKLFDSERIGLAAAWLYALNPNALFWSITVLTETLFSFLLILSFYLLILAVKRSQWRWFVLSGLILGLSILTRPIGLYLIPVWTLFILFKLRQNAGFTDSIKYSAIFLVAAMLLVLYWQTRNLIVNGRFSLSTTKEVTFSRFIAADTLAEALHIDRDEARLIIMNKDDPMAYSFQVIQQYPKSFLHVTARGVIRTVVATEVDAYMETTLDQHYHQSGLLSSLLRFDITGVLKAFKDHLQSNINPIGLILLIWGIVYTAILFIGIALGIIKVLRLSPSNLPDIKWVLLILFVSAGYLILIPLANGDARFRVPAAPMLALLGGLFFISSPKFPRRKQPAKNVTTNHS